MDSGKPCSYWMRRGHIAYRAWHEGGPRSSSSQWSDPHGADLPGHGCHLCSGPGSLATHRCAPRICSGHLQHSQSSLATTSATSAGQRKYRFCPIVHEIHGGMAKGADAAMRPSVKLWGKGRTRDAVTVRPELVGRLAAVITRTSTRAVQKRQMKKRTFATPDLSATMVRQMFLAVEPEQDDEELGEDRL